jgi:hypothetical protein
MAQRPASQEDIAHVTSKRQQCAFQFNLLDLATSMLRFYNLLVSMGHWPLNSLHTAPHQDLGRDTTLSQRLGFSPSAISVIQSLPYPSEDIIYDHDRAIFERTRILNLTDPEDLESSGYPTGDMDDPPLPAHLLTLMIPRAAEGSIVLLDTEAGAIYHYPEDIIGKRVWHSTIEYRVARQQNSIPETEDWGMFDPGLQHRHEYLPFTPAKQWFDEQYERWHSLRRLPFLDPRYEGDRDMRLDEVGLPGDWTREYFKKKQDALLELMEKFGWPDEARWNREGFLRAWEGLKTEFRGEEKARIRSVMGEV